MSPATGAKRSENGSSNCRCLIPEDEKPPACVPRNPCSQPPRPISGQPTMDCPPKLALSYDSRGQDGHVQKRICQIRFWPPGPGGGGSVQSDYSTHKCVCEKPADERNARSDGKCPASERNAFEERDTPNAKCGATCVAIEVRDSPNRRCGDDGKHLADSKGRCCADGKKAADGRKAADVKFPDGRKCADDRQLTPKGSRLTLNIECKTVPDHTPDKSDDCESDGEDAKDLQCQGRGCYHKSGCEPPKKKKKEPPKKPQPEDNSDLQCSGHRCRVPAEPIVQVAETFNSPMPHKGPATDTNWQRCGRKPLPHEDNRQEVWRADSYHSLSQNPFTMSQPDPNDQNPDQDDSSPEQPNDMLVCTSSCVCLNDASDSFMSNTGGSYCVTIEQCVHVHVHMGHDELSPQARAPYMGHYSRPDHGCTNEDDVNGGSSYLSIQNCSMKSPALYSALTNMPSAPLEVVTSTSSQDNCVKPPEQYRSAIQQNCSKPQEVYRVSSEPNCATLQTALSDCLSIITHTGPCTCTAPKNEAQEYKNLLLAALSDCLCASTHTGPCQCNAAKKDIKKDEDDDDQMVLPLKGSSEKLPDLDCQFSSLSSAPLQNTSSDFAPQECNTQEVYHVESHEKSAKPHPASSPPNRAELQSELSTLPLSTYDRHCSCSAARNMGKKRRDQTELCCAWQCNTEPSKLESATTCLDRALSSLNRAVAVLERKSSPVYSESISSYSSSCSDCKPSRNPSIPPGLNHVPAYEDTPCHKPDTHHEFGPRSIQIAPCCDIFNMRPQLSKKPEESEVYAPVACHTCSCRQSRKNPEDPTPPQSDMELDGRKWVKFSMQDLTHTYTPNECDNDYMNWLDNMEQ